MSSVETLSTLERRLSASIPQQQIRGEVEARLKRMGRTAKVHGFRPGKVPFKILEQQYGAQVHQEVLGDNLQRSFAEMAQQNSLKVAGYPRFEIKTENIDAPEVEYSATFEVYPEVVLTDAKNETVERVSFSLSDADVDTTLDTLRKQRAVYEPADRAASANDQVRIDFSGQIDGKVFDGGEAKDFVVVLGQGRMLPDFEAAIVGMNKGDSKSFDMTFPENYHGKDVAGKKVTFTIKLHAVSEAKLPEVDVAFAKTLGVPDGDVAKLKADIRENLSREAQRRIKARNKDRAMEVLLKLGQMEVPKSLVEMESKNLLRQTMHDMESRGVKMPQNMELPNTLFVEQATKRIKLGLILDELVRKHELAPKPEQVKAMVQEFAQSYEKPEEVIRWYATDINRMREVENLVLEDNVVDWLMSNAKVEDKTLTFNELMGNA